MRLNVLESVLNVIQNDSSLKTNEKDWLLFFSTWLYRTYENKYSKEDYITLSSNYLKKIFGDNYINLIKYFEQQNWIQVCYSINGNKSYTVGSESTKYFVTLNKDCNMISYKFTSKTVVNKITKLKEGNIREEYRSRNGKVNEQEIDLSLTLFSNLIHNNEELKQIELNYRSVLEMLSFVDLDIIDIEIEKIRNEVDTLTTKKQFKKVKKEIKNLQKKITTLLEEKHKLQDYTNTNDMKSFVIDGFGNRVHTCFSRLNKNYRCLMRLNDLIILEIDITNAQPWLLSNVPGITDEKFKSDCANGIFYEQFLKDFKGTDEEYKNERDKVKVFVYQLFFGTYQICPAALVALQDPNSILSRFNKLYPSVWEFIQEYNKTDHKSLSFTLQRMESDLIVYSVWNELFNKNIYAMTLHDGIFVNEADYNTALEVIKKNIELKGYTMPKFKTKNK